MKKLLLTILVLLMLSQPALADYSFDGIPFTDQLKGVAYGTVKGGVYVDGGHGIAPSPYTQSFNVPEGTVKWARLYVGVWGGTEEKTGSIAVTFNGKELGTLELEGREDTNPNVYCSGHGVYWIVYDVTSNTTSGPVDAVVTTSGDIDGRVYGVVLAAVYEDPYGQEVKYWINEGNVNLHAEGWSQDGVPLHTIEHGTVNGGIYVGGGHGKEYTTSYTQNFTVPNGTVKWARLYVSAKDTPWINVSLNGHLLGNYTDLTGNPKVYANYKPDRGMYWAYYDNAAEWLVNGTNTATADLGSRVGLNTKSWGIVLLAVYEGGDDPEHIEYWVNEGNPLLHSDHLPFTAHSNTTNTSFANIIDTDEVTNATLWTAYIWGSEESELQPHDSLWFNSRLIAEDASDGAGTDDQGNIWRGACFDLEKWDVTLRLFQNNVVSFNRGGDNLLCPVGAILVLQRGSAPASQTMHLGATVLPAVSLEVVPETLNFGALAPGEHSEMQILTLSNTCTNTISITADVADTAADLYVNGLLLDSENWNAFSRSIVKETAIEADAMLSVTDDYTGVGIQEGILIFWAEMA